MLTNSHNSSRLRAPSIGKSKVPAPGSLQGAHFFRVKEQHLWACVFNDFVDDVVAQCLEIVHDDHILVRRFTCPIPSIVLRSLLADSDDHQTSYLPQILAFLKVFLLDKGFPSVINMA